MFAYTFLRGKGNDHEERFIEVAEERLKRFARHALRDVEVDEIWYLAVNSDVNAAVEAGNINSGKEHYLTAGYFEDRWPRNIIVDEKWYISHYQDVAEAIKDKQFRSAQQHFALNGFREGRIPFRGWTLLSDTGSSIDS